MHRPQEHALFGYKSTPANTAKFTDAFLQLKCGMASELDDAALVEHGLNIAWLFERQKRSR